MFCAGEEVGTVSFNLSDYIGKEPVAEKARIGATLEGDATKFPRSYIEYRLTVARKEQAAADTKSSSSKVTAQTAVTKNTTAAAQATPSDPEKTTKAKAEKFAAKDVINEEVVANVAAAAATSEPESQNQPEK